MAHTFYRWWHEGDKYFCCLEWVGVLHSARSLLYEWQSQWCRVDKLWPPWWSSDEAKVTSPILYGTWKLHGKYYAHGHVNLAIVVSWGYEEGAIRSAMAHWLTAGQTPFSSIRVNTYIPMSQMCMLMGDRNVLDDLTSMAAFMKSTRKSYIDHIIE